MIELFKILDRDITKQNLMMHDAELFRELCEILQPENILCLGKITSECICEALAGDAFKKIFKAAKSYNDFLDNAPQIVVPCSADKKIDTAFELRRDRCAIKNFQAEK